MSAISLNKLIADSGYCSRREADELITQGRVTVNDMLGTIGMRIMPEDIVAVDFEIIKSNRVEDMVILAYHKPKGLTCTTDLLDKTSIMHFIKYQKRVFPIGRLDKDSEGLLLLTNNGDIVNKILRARNNHEKEYDVTVNKPVTKEFVKKMGGGLPILDTKTLKCAVKQTGSHAFTITLTQGLNRQIRRMCEFLDYRVSRLKRVRIMNIKLDVPTGQWRYLNEDEILVIKSMVAHSVKSFDASDYE